MKTFRLFQPPLPPTHPPGCRGARHSENFGGKDHRCITNGPFKGQCGTGSYSSNSFCLGPQNNHGSKGHFCVNKQAFCPLTATKMISSARAKTGWFQIAPLPIPLNASHASPSTWLRPAAPYARIASAIHVP